MILTNRETFFLLSLKRKYLKRCLASYNLIDKVILAIEIIEESHRNIIWRFFEYIYFFISFVFGYLYKKNKFCNISIGKYQLKIALILDYLNINYIIIKKSILIKTIDKSLFLSIYKNRNNKLILNNLIEREEFCFCNKGITILNKLEYFILVYSGNISFNFSFNYLYVVKELIYTENSNEN